MYIFMHNKNISIPLNKYLLHGLIKNNYVFKIINNIVVTVVKKPK